MSNYLPPFGVRGICSSSDFRVLQVLEAQYDSSIRSHPDAALTWLDEDDGETMTVGSGRELRERLADPVPSVGNPIKYHDIENNKWQNGYIHLFDISKSATSQTVWANNVANWRNAQPSTDQQSVQEIIGLARRDHGPTLVQDSVSGEKDQPKTEPEGTSSGVALMSTISGSVPELVECLGAQLGNLATLLEGTSNILRKAAEKTQDADTTPIEDVLSGMTTILGEVGAFGREVLGQLDQSLSRSTRGNSNQSPPESASPALDFHPQDTFSNATLMDEPILESSSVPLMHNDSSIVSQESVPGAWPIIAKPAPSLKLSQPVVVLDDLPHESSGAFFDRMISQSKVKPDDKSVTSSSNSDCKVSRHQSLFQSIKELGVPPGIQRSHTVAATNPAARLNAPFESVFPLPAQNVNKADSTVSETKPSAPGPVRSLHRSCSERRPRSLYEPYRPFPSNRSFSPVWEDQLSTKSSNNITSTKPVTNPVVIYAGNFAPRSGEQDIRNIVEAHCRTARGESGLQECTVLSVEPSTIVRLVLSNHAMAEKVILVFNKLILGGRILSLSFDRQTVESASRMPKDVPSFVPWDNSRHHGPQRMRSMPTFASSARPKPQTLSALPKLQPIFAPAAMSQPIVRDTAAPSRPVKPIVRHVQDRLVEKCEQKLRMMGYGQGDPAIMSRLHVYAAAANGVVEEAIELIDEDQKAHQVKVPKKSQNGLSSWLDDAGFERSNSSSGFV